MFPIVAWACLGMLGRVWACLGFYVLYVWAPAFLVTFEATFCSNNIWNFSFKWWEKFLWKVKFSPKQNSFPGNIDGTQYRNGCSKSPLHVSFNEWMAIWGRRHQVIRWLTSQKDLQKSAVDAAAMDFTVKAKYFYKALL